MLEKAKAKVSTALQSRKGKGVMVAGSTMLMCSSAFADTPASPLLVEITKATDAGRQLVSTTQLGMIGIAAVLVGFGIVWAILKK